MTSSSKYFMGFTENQFFNAYIDPKKSRVLFSPLIFYPARLWQISTQRKSSGRHQSRCQTMDSAGEDPSLPASTWLEPRVSVGDMSSVSPTYQLPCSLLLRVTAFCVDLSVQYIWKPFDARCCHMGTAIKHPVPDRVKQSFVIFDIRALWRSVLSVRVPGCQNDKINSAWHRMLYSCTLVATLGVKGLICALFTN